MEFFRRAAGVPRKLGVFPGSFNPPTRAHMALARAALGRVDEVVCVLPQAFPHKEYDGADFNGRLRMLLEATAGEPRFSIAMSRGGLFIEIARECRQEYGGAELYFLCGRDAAERIANWDYGAPDAFAEQLREYQLLVAPRQGAYEASVGTGGRVHTLALETACDEISATEVRERIRRGERWEELVPEGIAGLVKQIYGGG